MTESHASEPSTDSANSTASAHRPRFWPVAVGLAVLSTSVAWGQASSQAAPTASAAEVAQGAPDGAQVFAASCSSCHGATGEGVPGAFPPLAGNANAADADYVDTVVRDGLTEPIEVNGEAFDEAMPAVDLSDEERDAVVEYVVGLAGGDSGGPPPTTTTPAEPPEAGDVGAGRDLFVGSTQLADGGPACAACHTAGSVGNRGGSGLGPDLTDVAERLGGEAGLTGWMANPPTKTMTQLFADKPMTPDEIADLSVFLADAPEQGTPDDSIDTLTLAGVVGTFILLGGMAIAYRGMRQTYVERLKTKAVAR